MKFALGKEKKLKSKKSIDRLFLEGQSIRKGPLRLKYVVTDEPGVSQVAFSVPKRFFKKAVDRNRVKRLMRESYRLQQQPILELHDKFLEMMWIYQSNKLPDQELLNQLTARVLKDLIDQQP
jgi:ribonuclease P protein component